jgi:hypothetical protein
VTVWTLLRNLPEHVGPYCPAANGTIVDKPGVDKVKQYRSQDQENHILVGGKEEIGGTADGHDGNAAYLLVISPFEFDGLTLKPESIYHHSGNQNQYESDCLERVRCNLFQNVSPFGKGLYTSLFQTSNVEPQI